MSPLYLPNAAQFARHAYALESAGDAAQSTGEQYDDMEYRGAVAASVVFSVFFVEASIYEYLQRHAPLPEHLDPNLRYTALQYYWWFTSKSRNTSAMQRYNDVLSLHGADAILTGNGIGQDVRLLIELRNAIAHYRPQWEGEGLPVRDVARSLESRVNKPNPFRPESAARFPHYYLSHGCAEWAFNTGIAFYNLFAERLTDVSGIDPTHELLKTR
jgi:hypothetical protein